MWGNLDFILSLVQSSKTALYIGYGITQYMYKLSKEIVFSKANFYHHVPLEPLFTSNDHYTYSMMVIYGIRLAIVIQICVRKMNPWKDAILDNSNA